MEIGAFRTPIPGIKPLYVDRFAAYAGEATLADYFGDACDLPFFDSSLSYIASSHVIEHVANPFAALREWFRVLKHNGVIYLVVPDRRRTFDRRRELTTVEHMLEDYVRGVNQTDATHIDEFVTNVEWELFAPGTPAAAIASERSKLATSYHEAVRAGLEINIHFHTFEPATTPLMVLRGNEAGLWPGRIDVVEVVEAFPDSNPIGFLVIARIVKRWPDRLTGLYLPTGLRGARRLADVHKPPEPPPRII